MGKARLGEVILALGLNFWFHCVPRQAKPLKSFPAFLLLIGRSSLAFPFTVRTRYSTARMNTWYLPREKPTGETRLDQSSLPCSRRAIPWRTFWVGPLGMTRKTTWWQYPASQSFSHWTLSSISSISPYGSVLKHPAWIALKYHSILTTHSQSSFLFLSQFCNIRIQLTKSQSDITRCYLMETRVCWFRFINI